jgi:hypothetical protein
MVKAFDKPVHSWREIAAEAKKETDPKKLIELVETLCEALETIRLNGVSAIFPKRAVNLPLPEHSAFATGEQTAQACAKATVDFRQSIQAIQTVVRTIRLPLPKISSVARLPRKIV